MRQWIITNWRVLACAFLGLAFVGLILLDGMNLLPADWVIKIVPAALGAGAIVVVACLFSNKFDLNINKIRPQIMFALVALSVIALITIGPTPERQPEGSEEAQAEMTAEEQLVVQKAQFDVEREYLKRGASRQNIAALAVGGLIALATRLLESEKGPSHTTTASNRNDQNEQTPTE